MTSESLEIRRIPFEQRSSELRSALLEIMLEARAPLDVPETEQEAEAFQNRWLGSYLDSPNVQIAVALNGKGKPRGYILVQLEPYGEAEWCDDRPYYETFARHLKTYPAHLHINVAADVRSMGIGSKLIQHACQAAQEAGAHGMHLVTSADARNVPFYTANGFVEVARDERDKIRVMLAKRL